MEKIDTNFESRKEKLTDWTFWEKLAIKPSIEIKGINKTFVVPLFLFKNFSNPLFNNWMVFGFKSYGGELNFLDKSFSPSQTIDDDGKDIEYFIKKKGELLSIKSDKQFSFLYFEELSSLIDLNIDFFKKRKKIISDFFQKNKKDIFFDSFFYPEKFLKTSIEIKDLIRQKRENKKFYDYDIKKIINYVAKKNESWVVGKENEIKKLFDFYENIEKLLCEWYRKAYHPLKILKKNKCYQNSTVELKEIALNKKNNLFTFDKLLNYIESPDNSIIIEEELEKNINDYFYNSITKKGMPLLKKSLKNSYYKSLEKIDKNELLEKYGWELVDDKGIPFELDWKIQKIQKIIDYNTKKNQNYSCLKPHLSKILSKNDSLFLNIFKKFEFELPNNDSEFLLENSIERKIYRNCYIMTGKSEEFNNRSKEILHRARAKKIIDHDKRYFYGFQYSHEEYEYWKKTKNFFEKVIPTNFYSQIDILKYLCFFLFILSIFKLIRKIIPIIIYYIMILFSKKRKQGKLKNKIENIKKEKFPWWDFFTFALMFLTLGWFYKNIKTLEKKIDLLSTGDYKISNSTEKDEIETDEKEKQTTQTDNENNNDNNEIIGEKSNKLADNKKNSNDENDKTLELSKLIDFDVMPLKKFVDLIDLLTKSKLPEEEINEFSRIINSIYNGRIGYNILSSEEREKTKKKWNESGFRCSVKECSFIVKSIEEKFCDKHSKKIWN